MIPAFQKIHAIGTIYIKDIFLDGPIEITEKLDGSQFCFGKANGELQVRSRGKEINWNYIDKMFIEACIYVKKIEDKIPDNTVFYCEYLRVPHHNTLTYKTIPKNHLMLFGILEDGVFISNHSTMEWWATQLQIDVAPLLTGTTGETIPYMLKNMLETVSYLGGPKIEGVVVKNYNKSYWMGDRFHPIMCGKFVSEAFKEVHNASWKGDHTSRGGYDALKESYKADARWIKAVHALRDAGLLLQEPKDIGPLIRYIHDDIVTEEKELIKEKLWSLFNKEILGSSTRGVAEWYKEYLIKDTYGTTGQGVE